MAQKKHVQVSAGLEPPIGKGSQKIHITLERGLVKQADKFARQKGIPRSDPIARALAEIIGKKAG
jgi:metal-responsive CopG/Arc/MetJ family transcriptional regulator